LDSVDSAVVGHDGRAKEVASREPCENKSDTEEEQNRDTTYLVLRSAISVEGGGMKLIAEGRARTEGYGNEPIIIRRDL
jgi:hypothetical protein